VKESKKFKKMLEDHKKLLYPDCKAANGVTDKSFEELLGIIKNMLLEGNELPLTTRNKKGCLPS
jgi:hypothetical protein